MQIQAISQPDSVLALGNGGDIPTMTLPAPWVPAPALFALDLPGRNGLSIGAMMTPFQPVTVEVGDQEVELRAPIYVGALSTALPCASSAILDRQSKFEFEGMSVQLDSVETSALLSGANRFAVETESGWEILGAEHVVLMGPERYSASHLLRGLHGTDTNRMEIPSGAGVLWLGAGLADVESSAFEIGETISLTARSGGRAAEPLNHIYQGADLRPYAPAHLKAERVGDEINVSFIPRSQIWRKWSGADTVDNSMRYRIQLLANDAVIETVIVNATQETLQDAPTATHIRVATEHADYGWGATRSAEII